MLDDAAAVQAGDGAAAGVEEAEVVVDFGGGGDGGAGVAGLILLLDGDGGGEAVDVVDVGLFDALEELAGVGGERLDVAALAFGVDGVEGERGFAGAGDAGDDGEGVVRDVDVDALEVVGAGSADGDLVQVLPRPFESHGQTSIFRHEEGNCESRSAGERVGCVGWPLKC